MIVGLVEKISQLYSFMMSKQIEEIRKQGVSLRRPDRGQFASAKGVKNLRLMGGQFTQAKGGQFDRLFHIKAIFISSHS